MSYFMSILQIRAEYKHYINSGTDMQDMKRFVKRFFDLSAHTFRRSGKRAGEKRQRQLFMEITSLILIHLIIHNFSIFSNKRFCCFFITLKLSHKPCYNISVFRILCLCVVSIFSPQHHFIGRYIIINRRHPLTRYYPVISSAFT